MEEFYLSVKDLKKSKEVFMGYLDRSIVSLSDDAKLNDGGKDIFKLLVEIGRKLEENNLKLHAEGKE